MGAWVPRLFPYPNPLPQLAEHPVFPVFSGGGQGRDHNPSTSVNSQQRNRSSISMAGESKAKLRARSSSLHRKRVELQGFEAPGKCGNNGTDFRVSQDLEDAVKRQAKECQG